MTLLFIFKYSRRQYSIGEKRLCTFISVCTFNQKSLYSTKSHCHLIWLDRRSMCKFSGFVELDFIVPLREVTIVVAVHRTPNRVGVLRNWNVESGKTAWFSLFFFFIFSCFISIWCELSIYFLKKGNLNQMSLSSMKRFNVENHNNQE